MINTEKKWYEKIVNSILGLKTNVIFVIDPERILLIPELKNILQEHLSGKADHNYRLWILINLEIWYRIYFENESIDVGNISTVLPISKHDIIESSINLPK